MLKRIAFFALLPLMCLSPARAQSGYEHPIPFAPKQYVCYRSGGPLLLDGKGDDPDWQKAPWTEPFVDIEGSLKPAPTWETKAKMLWDSAHFYVFAKMDEPHIWATLKNRDDIIFLDDDFEVFIDPDGDAHNYYELEINALNTLWDLFMLWPYRQQNGPNHLFHWNIEGIRTAVHIEGTLNDPSDTDDFWSVEMAIPWSALAEMNQNRQPPKDGDQWRFNCSRVDWTMDIRNGQYEKRKGENGKPLPENNWVWSPMGFVNLHAPEAWGNVQFSEMTAGAGTAIFQKKQDEAVKWALWQLYFQQKAFFKTNKSYQADLAALKLPEMTACAFRPALHVTPTQFEFVAASCEGKGTWHINQDGRIYFRGKD